MFTTFQASFWVWMSFFLSAIILFIITIYHLYYEKGFSPFISSYIVFTFLFLLASPIAQINEIVELENQIFVNAFPYKENTVIYSNILICLFNIIFITTYVHFKKGNTSPNLSVITHENNKLIPFTIFVLTALSIFVFILSFSFVQEEFVRASWQKSGVSVGELLTWKKLLFMIPFGGIVLSLKYFDKKLKLRNNYLNIVLFFSILLLVFFWFKNPFTEKRNALGPIFLSLLYLVFPKLLNSNLKTLSFLFFSMIVAFPLIAMLTHSDVSFYEAYNNPYIIIEQMKGGGIINAFNTLNYDAFANIGVTIEYVDKHGFSLGYQLLGGLLFFIPRNLWTMKPYSSGQVIGEYLIDFYDFSFANISNPLVSESYINFGLFGVLVTPIILAFFILYMIRWLNGESYLKKAMAFYFAMHLIFLLRGDFTNGFAYYIAPLFAIVYVPKLIEYLTLELAALKNDGEKCT